MTTTVHIGKDKYHLQREMETWCEENINNNAPYRNWTSFAPTLWEDMGTWCIASAFGNTFFYFKNESDATAFTLKWQ
jgi:hypothetical protein